MNAPNYKLKGLIISKYGTQHQGAREFEMDEFRLSRIIHGRTVPKRDEKRRICWKLQVPMKEAFGE